MAGYLQEVGSVRQMLDTRYDDLKSGRVKPADGEEVFAKLRQKSKSVAPSFMNAFVLHPERTADLDEIWEYIAADSLDAADRCN